MDSIVEFVGFFYKKGDKTSCDDFDDCLWEKPWEEVTEDDNDSVIFKEDCFSMKVNSIVSLFDDTCQSGIEYMVDELGFNEVFKDFEEEIIKLGLSKNKKLLEVQETRESLEDVLYGLKCDITINKRQPEVVKLLTVWSFSTVGSGEDADFDWGLVGTIDQSKIRTIVEKI
jgi:hypothetical protein